MGYSIYFKPTEEAIEEYNTREVKSWFDSTLKYKSELLILCLQDNSNKPVMELVYQIRDKLKCIAKDIEMRQKKSAIDDFYNEGEFGYHGWQYSHDECNFDLDDMIDREGERLLLLAKVIPTPDYFAECEKFYQKWNEINNIINGFMEIVQEIVVYDIMHDFREYEIKNNDKFYWDGEEESEPEDNKEN